MIDLSCAIEACAVDVHVTRFLPAQVVKGRIKGDLPKQEFTIRASLQPATQAQLQLAPEGMRAEGSVALFTETKLLTVHTSESQVPDRLHYKGIEYQVRMVDDWSDLGNYYEVLASRFED